MSTIPQKALEWTLTKIGCAYSQNKRWNTNPDIFDCSSLVYRAYQAAGYTFKSGSTSNTEVSDTNFNLIWPAGRSVLGQSFTSINTLKAQGYKPQPGDVVYICTNTGTDRANKITHVVMVKDANTIVHARGTAYGVRADSIDTYGEKIVAVTRWHENAFDVLTTANAADALTTNAATSGQVVNAICSGNSVNLRSGPETDYAILAVLNRNHPMVTVTGSNGWARVTTLKGNKAYTGYMSTNYIEVLQEG